MSVREYTQVIKGKYDTKGSIKAMDILNNIPLTVEYFKTRPDVQQRIEKSINSNEYLAVYKGVLDQVLNIFLETKML